jgi:hypothetical protein
LTVVYSKATKFYHPLTNYGLSYNEEKKEWRCAGLSLDDTGVVAAWRIFQIIATSIPLGLIIYYYDQMNLFAEIIFWIGAGCFGYSLVLNYVFDLCKI